MWAEVVKPVVIAIVAMRFCHGENTLGGGMRRPSGVLGYQLGRLWATRSRRTNPGELGWIVKVGTVLAQLVKACLHETGFPFLLNMAVSLYRLTITRI